jgi:transcriptional repressor NrdR
VICPQCQSSDLKVLETRASAASIRRRRECRSCAWRFTTQERIELRLPLVVKKDGGREPFNRDKLVDGVQVACRKRPVTATRIEEVVNQVAGHVASAGPEVTTREIGDAVLKQLRTVDLVAYVRFASVYLEVQSPADFQQILQPWLDDPSPTP